MQLSTTLVPKDLFVTYCPGSQPSQLVAPSLAPGLPKQIAEPATLLYEPGGHNLQDWMLSCLVGLFVSGR